MLDHPSTGWVAPALSFAQASETQAGRGWPIHMQAPKGLHDEMLDRMSSGGGSPHSPEQSLRGGASGAKHLHPQWEVSAARESGRGPALCPGVCPL